MFQGSQDVTQIYLHGWVGGFHIFQFKLGLNWNWPPGTEQSLSFYLLFFQIGFRLKFNTKKGLQAPKATQAQIFKGL